MTYKTYSFGELVEKWVDNRGKTPPLSDAGIPLLEIKHLPERGIYPYVVDTKFVDQTTYESWFRAYLEPEDVLFSTVGTTARVMMTPSEEVIAIAQNILGIRFKKNIVDPWFMFYYMRARQFQHDIESRLVITVQASIKRSDMIGIPVDVPAISIQQAIVKKVFSLDLKIDLNHQINQTLEQMAQAIFKSWFVDFEPVKAKIAALEAGGSEDDALLAAMQAIAGSALFATDVADADAQTQLARLKAEHPEQYTTLRATAELFPSAMQESELGEIPEGWRASKLSDEFDVTMGQSPPGHTYNEAGDGVPFFQGRRDFGVRYPSNRVYCTEPKRMAKAEDTLLSVRAPVGDTNVARTDCCIGRGIAALRHKSGCSSFTYYSVIQLGQVLSSYDSEGTVFGSINQKNLKSLRVIAPTKEILSVFSQIVGATDSRIKSLSEEVSKLTELRDTLLPRLLSGEIDVSTIAK